jgi:putative phage-type endonuclease
MEPIYHDMPQGEEAWFAIKLGKVSASVFSNAIAGGAGKTRTTLMRKLIAERMTNEPQESFSNSSMDRGIEVEPEARKYYEMVNDCIVKEVGFVELNEDIGVSPDGLVGEDGLLEIKCPNSANHIGYILDNKLPSTYKAQVQGQLWVTGRKWCDFVSYDPRVSKRPYWAIRVNRDEKYIAELDVKINIFITDLKTVMEKLTASPF